MTPEEYADAVLSQITLEPQGRWDADVVEFETKSMGVTDFRGLLVAAIASAVAQERVRIAAFIERIESSGGPDGVRWTIPGHDCSGWGCAELGHLAETIRNGEAK